MVFVSPSMEPNMRVGSRRVALLAGALVAVLAVTALTSLRPQPRIALRYRDPSVPCADRVTDLLSRMTLADKVGQMTQAERAKVTAADLTRYRLGSVLSGGGSAPPQNNPTGWADMYDEFQR